MSIQTSTSLKPEFREATNLLRGICAFAIIVWHYQHFFYNGLATTEFTRSSQPFYNLLSPFYESGYFAVQIFWCISGLIMTHSYVEQSSFKSKEFAIARFARLYPIHLITLVVVVVLQQISLRSVDSYQIYGTNDFFHFILNIFFAQSWGFEKDVSFNAPSWSVSIEILIYLLFCAIVPFLKRFRVWVPITILIFYRLSLSLDLNSRFHTPIVYFFLGVLIYFIGKSKYKKISDFSYVLIFAFEITAYIGLRNFGVINFGAGANGYVWSTAFLVLIVSQIDHLKIVRLLIRARVLGDISYSVFLWHIPLQISIKLVQANYAVDLTIAHRNIFFILYISLTYILGYFSYKHIEQPAQRYFRQKLIRTQQN